ncbi:MAG: (2Fe-2S) ferredoxin domain-containing protein [Pseudomonadota bacterium]|nr:(2Fe-2S) ferredoxin domain-containing protein [Pseudomonadota bacterium]
MTAAEDETPKPWLRACINFRAGNRLPSCGTVGSREMVAALTKAVEDAGIGWRIEAVHCMGQCHAGPTMRILPNGPYVMGVQEADVPEVIEKLTNDDLDGLAATYPMPGRDTND